MKKIVLLCGTVVLVCVAIIAIVITISIIALVVRSAWEEIDSWMYFRNLEKKRNKGKSEEADND